LSYSSLHNYSQRKPTPLFTSVYCPRTGLTFSRWIEGLGDWEAAYQKAQAFVSQLTLLEKVNLTTGTGWQSDHCVGNTGGVPRLNFTGICNQDAPLGVRFADYVSAFPAGGTIAAAWDRGEWYLRGYQMGSEHRDKGVDVQLGPVVGPLGRNPKGGVSNNNAKAFWSS
jgi:beta-glucosidase